MTLKRNVPYLRAKLGPRSPIWADDNTLWGDDGLQQGSPSSSGSAFALTIRPWVREADMKLTAAGGCARFGMNDGCMAESREVVFKVMAEFAEGIG